MPRKTADEVPKETSKDALKRITKEAARQAPPLLVSSPLAAPPLCINSPLPPQHSPRIVTQSKRSEKRSHDHVSEIHVAKAPFRLLELPRDIFWKILAYVLEPGIVTICWHRVSDRTPSQANKKPLANIVPVQEPRLPSILLASTILRSECYHVFCTDTTFSLGSPVGLGRWDFALRLRKLYQSITVNHQHTDKHFISVRASGALHGLVGTKYQPGPLALWTTEHFPALRALTLYVKAIGVTGEMLEQLVMCVRSAAMGIAQPRVRGFSEPGAAARIEDAMRCARHLAASHQSDGGSARRAVEKIMPSRRRMTLLFDDTEDTYGRWVG